MREALRLIVAPTEEPVSVPEAKAHLRLEHSLDDLYVAGLIRAARQHVEDVSWRALITQTWELALDAFPCWRSRAIHLPKGHVQSVTSVKYDDENGVEQTMAPADWELDGIAPARLALTRNASWPSNAASGDIGSVRIRYVAGYGLRPEVPQALKQCVLLLVSQMYEHRTPEVIGAVTAQVQMSFDALLSPYRLVQVL